MRETDRKFQQIAKSLWEYFVLSWWIYLTILIMAIACWVISIPGPLAPDHPWPVYVHWMAFLAHMSSDLLAAFLILLLTDFIGRTHLDKLNAEFRVGAETTQEAMDWGLRLYPSHDNRIIATRERVLEDYLESGDVLRILSGTGFAWLGYQDSLINYLIKDGIQSQVILFSPQMYFDKLFSSAQIKKNREMQDAAGYLAKKQVFSRYNVTGESLINHHQLVRVQLLELHPAQRSRLAVRFTGVIPLCEFFVVGNKRAHGAVPMQTKTHRDAFSIQTFCGLRYGEKNVQEFITEFQYFWKAENSISAEEYFSLYGEQSSAA